MSARLVPLGSSRPAVDLQRPVLLVGRHPECDIRLDLPGISRRHCCFAIAYGRLTVRDLGSKNGLRVNGHVVEESRLRNGDEVAVGPLIYRVEDLTPEPAAAPAPVAAPAPKVPPPVETDDDDLVPLSGLFPDY